MDISHRWFIAAGLAGVVVACTEQSKLSPEAGASSGKAGAEAAGGEGPLVDEDGSKLWLRFAPPGNSASYKRLVRQVVVQGDSATMRIIKEELLEGLGSMIGLKAPAGEVVEDGSVIVATRANIAGDLRGTGPEGYIIRSTVMDGHPVTVIASEGELGALYGTYHFLRLIQTGKSIAGLDIAEKPAMQIRMADHWDNMNGSIERGYAGRSLWFSPQQWNALPEKVDERIVAYARAQASLGMNGACLNNVNASAATLETANLKKVAAIADAWRPYGIRPYLSANFAAPVSLGKLATADPLDAGVLQWWKDKAKEIYELIPNFGGLLVKANSEGQPGPKDYNRNHAEGANCLAEAFGPHNGIVIWRAFVYDETVDADRVKRAYIEFMALDGKFKPNVLIQIKNGPLDFQPREPFSPLFGALKQTSIMVETQPSQEYLGQGKHLVYLGTMWAEFLGSDTYAKGKGSTVAKVLERKVQNYAMTGTAGVLNPGLDVNWTGHHFCQSNWYAQGRLAWNPELTAATVAEEWTRMTFSNDPAVVKTIVDLMMGSRETFLNYTMPLGLHHMIDGDHYAPAPWNARAARKDWTAVYYHQADEKGIGFDRTRKGDKAVDQYFAPLSDEFDSFETCPEKYLLWFHHLAWDYKMKSGKTLWREFCEHYFKGVRDALAMQATWAALAGKIDAARHKAVADRMVIQVADAAMWRDKILAYFSGINKLPIETT